MTLTIDDDKLRELIREAVTAELAATKPAPPPSGLLTVAEAAKVLGMSRAWVYGKSNDGTLPCRRFGSAIRFDSVELTAFRDKGNAPRLK